MTSESSTKLILVSLILVLFGILLVGVHGWLLDPDNPTAINIGLEAARGLGIAMLIAVVLLWVVTRFIELPARESKLKEIEENVFSGVLGFVFPEQIKAQIEEYILHYPFIRSDYNIQVSLYRGNEGYLDSEIIQEYDLCKRVESVREYRLEAVLDNEVPAAPEPRFTKLTVSDATGVLACYNEEQLKKCSSSDSRGTRLSKAIDLSGKKQVHVRLEAQQCHPDRNFSVWMVVCMTNMMRVIYSFPEDLVLHGFANHPSKDLFNPIELRNSATYELKAGLLPYQGITVHWHPKPPTNDSNDVDKDSSK